MSAFTIRNLSTGASALALALAFAACNQSDPVQAPTAPVNTPSNQMPTRSATPYQKELLALKAQKLGLLETRSGIVALKKKYGYATPDLGPVLPMPENQEEESAPATDASGRPLGKAAAVATWKTVKNFNFGNARVIMQSCVVPANRLFQAWVSVDAAHSDVDPVAVAWYKPDGIIGDAYNMIVADVNDDSVTQEPSLLWFNNTGASKRLYVMAFAYDVSLAGPATLTILPTNTDRFDYPGWVGGLQIYNNTRVSTTGCTGPTASRITSLRISGKASTRGVLAVNEVNRTGVYILNQNATITTFDGAIPNQNSEVSWNPSFVLGFSLAGQFDVFPETIFNAKQEDLYRCN